MPAMPTASVFFENLPRLCEIEERGAVNRYFVYLGGTEEAVVCWSPNTHPHAQARLQLLADERLRRTLRTTDPPHPRKATKPRRKK